MKKYITAFVTLFVCLGIQAQPIELVVPYPPGGAVDIFARNFQKYLNNSDIKSIISNKAGADGKIGTTYVLNKPSDSNTMLVAATGPMLFNKVLYANNSYDYSQFDITVPIGRVPLGIAVSNNSGINSLEDFIKQGKVKKLNCGTSNSASAFAGKYIIKQLELAKTETIPFKGANDVTANLIGNNIDCAFDSLTTLAYSHREGKIKLIAIASQSKYSEFPNIPLVKQTVKDFEFYFWFGLASVKGSQVDQRVVAQAYSAFKDIALINSMKTIEVEIVKPPADSQKWLDHEYNKFETMRQQLGLEKVTN